ncbi:MAG: lipopolysaccharide core heptose(I) kinase RfaP [Gammaproteobacteria bacterium]
MYFRRKFYTDLSSSDPFATLMQQEGHIYRQVKGRKTIRFVLNNQAYFAKLFSGISFAELIKNLIKGQWPVADVSHERRALEILSTLGIRAPQVVAYGNDEACPLHRHSFIVMQAVEPAISLEEYLHDWANKPLAMRRALIKRVAEIARNVHENGISHRDFYICHFLLETPQGEQALTPNNINISLIDWHRARFQLPLPEQWLIKDLAALYFSVMSASLTSRDYLRFLQVYTQQPLRQSLCNPIWRKVKNKAQKLYAKTYFPNSFSKHIKLDQKWNSPELMRVLSDPESIFTRAEATIINEGLNSTLVKFNVDGRDIIIKRYRWKQGWYGLTRLFRPSRASRSWNFAQVLLKNNIATPHPIALVEKRWGYLRRDSYYIMEYCGGNSLGSVMRELSPESVTGQDLFAQWQKIHQQLLELKITHGDTSHENYLVTQDGLKIIDLDTMHQHFFAWRLQRRQLRDQERFIHIWSNYMDRNKVTSQ